VSASRGVERAQLAEHEGREVGVDRVDYVIISRSQEFLFSFLLLALWR
jgi:hypothetical protein